MLVWNYDCKSYYAACNENLVNAVLLLAFLCRKGGSKMPFVEVNIQNEIEKQRQNNPEFRKAWDESRADYKSI